MYSPTVTIGCCARAQPHSCVLMVVACTRRSAPSPSIQQWGFVHAWEQQLLDHGVGCDGGEIYRSGVGSQKKRLKFNACWSGPQTLAPRLLPEVARTPRPRTFDHSMAMAQSQKSWSRHHIPSCSMRHYGSSFAVGSKGHGQIMQDEIKYLADFKWTKCEMCPGCQVADRGYRGNLQLENLARVRPGSVAN